MMIKPSPHVLPSSLLINSFTAKYRQTSMTLNNNIFKQKKKKEPEKLQMINGVYIYLYLYLSLTLTRIILNREITVS